MEGTGASRAFKAEPSCVLTGVQEGGVLKIRSGAVQFESVAISDTYAYVRVVHGGRSGRRRIGAGGGVQSGGVVMISGGSVEFKGGSIARSSAVRDPRCCQMRVLHGVASGALHRVCMTPVFAVSGVVRVALG
jgi:hypothetical protein